MDYFKTQRIRNAVYNSYILTKSADADKLASHLQKETGETLTPEQVSRMKLNEFMQTKANEAMSTGQAGFGGDAVNSEVMANIIVDRVRDRDTLLSFLPNQKTMLNPIEGIFVEGADVEMTSYTEASDVPGQTADTAKAGTDKLVLDASDTGLALTIHYTRDLLEDSVIDIGIYLERKLERAFVNTVHQALINGDTDDTINGTTGTTSARRKFDGYRKLAIDNSRVTSGTLTLANIRAAKAQLGVKSVNTQDLLIVMDYESYNKLLSLSQVETIEKFGDAATVKNGTLPFIDGIRVLVREEIGKAQSTGIIDTAVPANNDHGQAIILHRPSTHIGRRRMLSIEGDYDSRSQQYYSTGSTRFDFVHNEKDAPSAALLTIA